MCFTNKEIYAFFVVVKLPALIFMINQNISCLENSVDPNQRL